jgi:hypothetical protein
VFGLVEKVTGSEIVVEILRRDVSTEFIPELSILRVAALASGFARHWKIEVFPNPSLIMVRLFSNIEAGVPAPTPWVYPVAFGRKSR